MLEAQGIKIANANQKVYLTQSSEKSGKKQQLADFAQLESKLLELQS